MYAVFSFTLADEPLIPGGFSHLFWNSCTMAFMGKSPFQPRAHAFFFRFVIYVYGLKIEEFVITGCVIWNFFPSEQVSLNKKKNS